MICNQNTKIGEKTKLLAVIAALVMVACALVAVLPSAEVSGAPMPVPTVPEDGTTGVVYIDNAETATDDFQAALADTSVSTIVVTVSIDTSSMSGSITIPADKTVYVGAAADDNVDRAVSMTIGSNVTLNIEGKVYNLLGTNQATSGIVNNGTVVFSGHGLMASTSAVATTAIAAPFPSVTGFFTANTQSNVMRQYYAADINDIAGYVVANDYSDTDGAESRIYTYGNVSIDAIDEGTDLSATTIVVGGVTAQQIGNVVIGGSTLTVAEDVAATIGGLNVKSVGISVNNGSLTVKGTATVAGTFTNNGEFSATELDVDDTTNENASFVNNGSMDSFVEGVDYTDGSVVGYGDRYFNVYKKSITVTNFGNVSSVYFYLGVSLGSPVYTGDSFNLADLEPRAIILGSYYTDAEMTAEAAVDGKTLDIDLDINTGDNADAESQLENMVDVGTYTLPVRVNASASLYDSTGGRVSGGGSTVYRVNADFTIQPVVLTVSDVKMSGWQEGNYGGQTPTFTVKDQNGGAVSAENYTSTWQIYEDKACTKPVTLDYNDITFGTYWVKVTVTPNNADNVKIDEAGSNPIAEFEITVDALGTEIEFYSLENLGADVASQILSANTESPVSIDSIQKNIQFDAVANPGSGYSYNVTVSGQVFPYDITKAGTDINGVSGLSISETGNGYFIAFYIVGVGFDVTDETVDIQLGDAKIAEITVEDDTNPYRYYIAYIGTTLNDEKTDAGEFTEITQEITADRDGEEGSKYVETGYTLDFTYLNLYRIVFNDENNDTLYYWAVSGEYFTIPSGAGDNFTHWTTEEGCDNADRTLYTDSVMVVGQAYDAAPYDFEINLYAVYGEGTTGGNTGADTEATNVLVSLKSNEGGVYVILNGMDGYVPEGTLTVYYSYVYYNEVFGITTTTTGQLDAELVQNADGSISVILDRDLPADLTIVGVWADFTYGETTAQSDIINY